MNIVEKAEKNNTENQKMEELLKIVQQYTEDDFQKIISEKKDFFFLYHLSPMRRNILEWYPLRKMQSIRNRCRMRGCYRMYC